MLQLDTTLSITTEQLLAVRDDIYQGSHYTQAPLLITMLPDGEIHVRQGPFVGGYRAIFDAAGAHVDA